ncbi:MAG: hypothetical protein ACOX18_07190 [Bacillota bacterium]|jgi:hypothetical protein
MILTLVWSAADRLPQLLFRQLRLPAGPDREQYPQVMRMRRTLIVLLLLILLPFDSPLLEEGVYYSLVLPDGRVIATTEFPPSVGDVYWDATTDSWYQVVSVVGQRAVLFPQAQARVVRAQRNLSLLIIFLVGAGLMRIWRRERRNRLPQ